MGAGHPGWLSGLASKLVKKSCQVAQEGCSIPSQSRPEDTKHQLPQEAIKGQGLPNILLVALPWSYQITESAQSSVLVTPDFLMEFLIQLLVLVLLQELLVL